MIKRLVNFRCFLILILFIIGAILLCRLWFVSKALTIVILSLLVIGLLVAFLLFYKHKGLCIQTLTILLCGVIVAIVGVNSVFVYENWTIDIMGNQIYSVKGRVENVSLSDIKNEVILGNLYIDGDKVDGKMTLTLEQSDRIIALVGNSMEFSSSLRVSDLEDIQKVGRVFRQDVRYYAQVNFDDVKQTLGKMTFLESVSSNIYKTLTINIGTHYGAIAFSMLTGDKNFLDTDVLSYYGASGLRHIMAVSGLHIGFVCLLFTSILQKLKVNKLVNYFLITAFLIFYAFLAGFSPSVMRAIAMCQVGLVGKLFSKWRDALTSLCFAMAMILLISPLYLFEAGFILSCSAVFGLIMFSQPLTKFFQKLRLPKFIASALSTSLSAQIGIFPAMTFFFAEFQTYAILLNVFLMPVIMFTFFALVITLIFTLLIPFLGFYMNFPLIGLKLIDNAALFVSQLPFAQILVYSTFISFLCYPLYFVVSRFFMLGKYKKLVSVICAFSCIGLCLSSVILIPYKDFKYSIVPMPGYQSVSSVIASGEDLFLVGDLTDPYTLKDTMMKLKTRKLTGVFIYELNKYNIQTLKIINTYFRPKFIYCPIDKINADFRELKVDSKINFYAFEEFASLPNQFSSIKSNKTSFYLYEGEVNILFSPYKGRYTNLDVDIINETDIIRCYNYLDEYPDRMFLLNYAPPNPSNHQLSTKFEEIFIFNFLSGKISVIKP